MNTWKTVKIFISSTFKDLEKERDELSETFQKLRKEFAKRQLHIIPYDLRWQDQNNPNLVRWCLDKVLECEYFVAIIGNRYGWQPPYDYNGNKNNVSITEMEIEKALQCVNKSKRFFCLLKTKQEITEKENQQKIEHLKIKIQQEKIIDCDNDNVVLTIYQQFFNLLNNAYPEQKITSENNNEKQFLDVIEEKAKGFVGRESYLNQLRKFCHSRDNKILHIEAIAGSGKSALVSYFLKTQKINFIAYYASLFENSTLYSLHKSLAEQLKNLGTITHIETIPDKLAQQIKKSLKTYSKPIVLLIDAIDELSSYQEFLEWFPIGLPPHVRVIFSARPGINYSHYNNLIEKLNLAPMTDLDVIKIIDNYQGRHKLSLSIEEKKLLLKMAMGNPLYLKVALEELTLGGSAVGHLAQNVEALFYQILERLQKKFDENIINDYLGLIAASRYGIAEVELEECLLQKYPRKVYMPFILEIEESLSNFVILRKNLYQFFHLEFERSVKMMLGRSKMRNYHQWLAKYFEEKNYSHEKKFGYENIRTV